MDDAKLDELLALAEKAARGSWTVELPHETSQEGYVRIAETAPFAKVWTYVTREEWDRLRAEPGRCFFRHNEECTNDAKFIAALDPATIRALVQEVKDWRATSAYFAPPVHVIRLATAVDEGGVNDTIERTGKGSFKPSR